MIVGDVSSSHGEFVIPIAGVDELVVPPIPLDVPLRMERSEDEARVARPQPVRNEPVCIASITIAWPSVPCGDVSKDGEVGIAVDVVKVEDYVDVAGSSTPVQCGVESEGFTFRESVKVTFVRDSGGFSGLPMRKVCLISFTLCPVLLVRYKY